MFLHFLQKYRCVPKIGFSADISIDVSIDIFIDILIDAFVDISSFKAVYGSMYELTGHGLKTRGVISYYARPKGIRLNHSGSGADRLRCVTILYP